MASEKPVGVADIGVTGLAVMGSNLARNFARHGHKVAVHNRTYARTERLVAEHGDDGTFVPSESMEDFVASLAKPRVALIMVKAGAPTDAVIDELAQYMEPGDIIVDGGNAHFPDTIRREQALKEKGLHFVGSGVSGGEEGALNGPSIMPGGTKESYDRLGPMLESISAHVDGVPCCTHVGPDGAGHFVKMVHNGIEYADMQLIAEAYDLLRQGLGASAAEIGKIFEEWNAGRPRVLPHRDHRGRAPAHRPADRQGVRRHRPRPGRAEGHRPLDGAERPRPGRADHRHRRGHLRPRPVRVGAPARGRPRRPARRRRHLGRHRPRRLHRGRAPGAVRLEGGRLLPGLRPDRGRLGRSSAGTSTAAPWPASGAAAASSAPGSSTASPRPTSARRTCRCSSPTRTSPRPWTTASAAWRRVVSQAALNGVPTPAFASSLSYYDGIRAERLPAALIQAQRDFFGAHTYHRVDQEGVFHTLWSGDRSEEKQS